MQKCFAENLNLFEVIQSDKYITSKISPKKLRTIFSYAKHLKNVNLILEECLNDEKGKKLYEGKAKIIYATQDKGLVIQYFKDDATAFNNQKKSTIEGKGVLNNRISEHILSNLSQIGIKNHLVKRLNMREQLIKLVETVNGFITRNVATRINYQKIGY